MNGGKDHFSRDHKPGEQPATQMSATGTPTENVSGAGSGQSAPSTSQ